jgi:hypothetical protein
MEPSAEPEKREPERVERVRMSCCQGEDEISSPPGLRSCVGIREPEGRETNVMRSENSNASKGVEVPDLLVATNRSAWT